MPGSHPYSLDGVLQNQLSNLVPLRRTNQQIYQLGYKHPEGDLDGYAPSWEVVNFRLGPRLTKSARINVQRDFHLLGLIGSSSIQGTSVPSPVGFRCQLFDVSQRKRLQDRGFGAFNLLGGQGSILFLRRPYRLKEIDGQLLVEMQSYDTVNNTENEVVLYGCVLRFNDPRTPRTEPRHGHQFMRRFLDPNLGWPWFPPTERKSQLLGTAVFR